MNPFLIHLTIEIAHGIPKVVNATTIYQTALRQFRALIEEFNEHTTKGIEPYRIEGNNAFSNDPHVRPESYHVISFDYYQEAGNARREVLLATLKHIEPLLRLPDFDAVTLLSSIEEECDQHEIREAWQRAMNITLYASA